MRVCVLGGGVVGIATAYYLARDGHVVDVVERGQGAGEATSFANGGQLSYSYVAPLADPGVLAKLPGWLLSRESPVRFTPRLELQQWRWGLAFLAACTAEATRQGTIELLSLGLYSRSLVHTLVREESIAFDYRRNGKLVLYRDARDLEGAKRQMDFQAKLGCEQQALDSNACLALEPALAPFADKLAGGIHTPSEDAGDCYKFTTELARVARDRYGVRFHFGCTVQSLVQSRGRVAAVCTDQGEIAADAFVVALGMGSLGLLKPLGLSVPLYPINGYSVTIPVRPGHAAPRLSITDAHRKIVYARLGDRFRAAGIADITGLEPRPDPRRLALLLRQARETFPDAGDWENPTSWYAQRPATPTSKPLLGATPIPNLWLNIGQGALGFTLACGSARLVADQMTRQEPSLPATPFALAA